MDRGAARYPSLAPQPGWVHPAGLLAGWASHPGLVGRGELG